SQDLLLGAAGALEPDRSRHVPAGGGRGAARLDRRAGARGRARRQAGHARRPHRTRPQGAGHADGRGRHERHPVPRRRQHDRSRLLARRRRGARCGRRPRAARRALRAPALTDRRSLMPTIDPLPAAGVVLATAATDAVYVMFTSAVIARKRIPAASWSAFWYVLSSYAVISYTDNWVYVA